MAAKLRARLLPDRLSHPLSDWDLRESLRTLGQQMPVLTHRDEVIDGRRRLVAAESLGIELERCELPSVYDAARALWLVHPRRAWDRFRSNARTRAGLATLFGTRLDQIPTAYQLRDQQHRRRGKPTLRCAAGLEIDAEVYVLALTACRGRGTTLNAMLRHHVYALAGVPHPHPLGSES